VLPIVGSSGMGKTSLLAHLLGSGKVDPAVMVPAYRIDFTSTLQDALLAAFADAVEPFDATTVQNVEQALRKAKRELVFILDGLNEARATAAELRPWLERSMEWLRKAPVRLIVSCRTDFWRLVSEDIPRDLTFEQNASMRSVNVEWFSEEEVKAAVSAYRLPPAAHGLRALRNPLLVRLYWALGEKTGTGRVDAYTLLDGFADEISRTVAKRLDGMSEGIVRAKLVALTGLMDASLNIDAHEFAEAFASEPRLRDVLFRENVVVDAGSTAFRFLFDELAEFLIGSTRTLPAAKDERAWLPLLTSRNALASLRYTFIRLEREGRVAEIRTALSRMIATLYSGNTFLLDLALQEIVSNLSDPRPYFDLILEMVRKSASPRRSAYGTSAFVALPHTITLEPPQQLALLRELFPAERDYWWKLKTWRREGPHMLSWPQSLAAALADLILRDPKTTFAALAQWLDDTRPLAGSSAFPEATVSDVAQCFLFWFRERAFDQVCDIAAEHEREGNHLLFMLVESDPHRVLGAVERWKTRPELHEIAAHVANRLASIATIDQTRLRRVLESLLAQKVTAVVRTTATAALARVSPDPGAHVEQLLGAFLRDDPAALPASLPLADPRYTAKVLDAFARYLKRGKDDDRKQDILNNLDFVAERVTPGEQLLIAEMVADLKPSKALAIAYGSSIERLLHLFPAGSRAFATLLDVATRILRKGPVDAQGYVIHAATSPRMEPEKRGDQKRLIEIVMAKDGRDAKVELRAALAAYPDLFEQTMEWMLALTEDIEGTRFGEGLCWTAYMHEDFGRLFASWAVTQPESSLSGFALGLKRDIGRGRTPKDVLQEHLPEMMR